MKTKRFQVSGYDPEYGFFSFQTEIRSEAEAKAQLWSKHSKATFKVEDLDDETITIWKGGYPFRTI